MQVCILNIMNFSLFPKGCNMQVLHSSQTNIKVKNVAFSNGSDKVKDDEAIPYSPLRIIQHIYPSSYLQNWHSLLSILEPTYILLLCIYAHKNTQSNTTNLRMHQFSYKALHKLAELTPSH